MIPFSFCILTTVLNWDIDPVVGCTLVGDYSRISFGCTGGKRIVFTTVYKYSTNSSHF